MRHLNTLALATCAALAASACADGPSAPTAAPLRSSLTSFQAWGPETPNFNLEVVLRGDGGGFGLVKFRQPNDEEFVVHLDTWVRDLTPNASFLLQRAVDPVVDDDCTGSDWLTLGQGLTAHAITTDDKGAGTADLWRAVPGSLVGMEFDIHFRVIAAATGAVVLQSECYQYTISL